jgi:hypothetical protein
MADDSTTTTTTPGTGEDVEGLKKALATERDARKQADKEAKAATKTLEEVQGRLAKLESDGKSETEKAIEKARNEASEEARKDERDKWASKFVQSEVKAAAAQKLADPDDARLLDLSDFQVAEDGSIQGDINAAVDKLLESKPHLAARRGTRQSVDAGPQGGTPSDSVDALFGKSITDSLAQ